MRKYGKLLLVLGILSANPAWVSADGLLNSLRSGTTTAKSVQKQQNQKKAEEVGYALKRARINGYDLQVEVRGEAVRIDGKVRDVTHRALAEQVCRRIAGIKTVQNNLRYVPGGAIQQTSGQFVDNAVQPAYHMSEAAGSGIQQVHFQKPGKRKPKAKTSSRPTTSRQTRSFSQPRPIQQQQQQQAPKPAPPAISYKSAAAPAPPATAPAPVLTAPMPKLPTIPKTVEAPKVTEAKVVTPVAAKATRTNQQVAQQIGSNLADVGLVGYDVEIRYDNGIATLGGDVASAGQRQAAEFAASKVAEVKSVRNELGVKAPIAQTSFGAPRGQRIAPAAMTAPMPMGAPMGAPMMMGAPMGAPMGAGAPTSIGGASTFSNPQMPDHAWPAQAQYPNSAAIQYPTQYSASAFPYIGPFYPYPQVPLGWRESRLEWDDGHWQLNFEERKDAWYWLFSPKNWK